MTRHMLHLIKSEITEGDSLPDLDKEVFPYDEKYPYEGQDDELDDFDETEDTLEEDDV